jgi:hypothetical protein
MIGHVPLARIGEQAELSLRPEMDSDRPDLQPAMDDFRDVRA